MKNLLTLIENKNKKPKNQKLNLDVILRPSRLDTKSFGY